MYLRLWLLFAFLAVALTACGEVAQFPVAAGVGTNPLLWSTSAMKLAAIVSILFKARIPPVTFRDFTH
jgi:hypothetical protein